MKAFPAGGTLLERSDDDLLEILPSPYHSVSVGCLVAADSLTEMYFAFETEMQRLLDTKGRTGGLNTDRIEPRNCHIWLAPIPVPDDLKGCAVIAEDKRLPTLSEADVRLPHHDLRQAMMSDERFKRVVD